MGRTARLVIPGLSHHVTHRGNNRQSIFFTEDDRRFYLDVLADYCEQYELRIEAYCLMTNHVHFVGVPAQARSLELAVGRTHQRYAQYVNYHHGRSGHLWRDRFFSCPMDEVHRDRALRYVECNPVRARMVEQAWQYAWSSAAAHCADREPHRLLDRSMPSPGIEAERWRDRLRPELDPQHLEAIRRQTLSDRPLATDGFIAKLEAQLGRRLRPNPVGRPPTGRRKAT